MAQFYTKERSVQGASPQIYDDSQRILTKAENFIESMRAVSSIEEQQNATLINNLRAHRQREKELNTRNHQMLMDNMQQVAEAQQRKDQIALNNNNLKRKEDIAQEQRTMETLATLSEVAGKAAGAMIKDGIAKANENMQAEITQQGLIQQRFPSAKDGEGLAHDALLAIDQQAEVGELTVASLAKNAGKEMNFVAGLFIKPERLERQAAQLLANDLAVKVEGGYLEDIIRQDPTKVVSYEFNGETVERPLSDVIQGKIQSSEEINRIYSALNDELFTDLKAGRDPILFLKADEKTRNVINTRALKYGDKLTKSAIERYNSVQLQSVLLGDSPEEVAKNAVKYITQSGLNPTLGHGDAISSITSDILPNVSDPVAFAKAIGEEEFSDHMPGVKIGATPFGTSLKIEAQRLQVEKEQKYRAQQKQIGTDKALEFLEGAISDGTPFNALEQKAAAQYSQDLYDNESISFVAKRAFDTLIDESYTQLRDNKAVIAELDELADNLDLSQTRINNEYRAGNIDKEKAEELGEKIETFTDLKGSDGKPITGASIKGVFGRLATTRVDEEALAGEAKSYTALMVKDQGFVIYKTKLKELSETIADPQLRHEQAVMSTVEWINGLELLEDENGITHFKNYHTSFTSTKYPKQPTLTADEVGKELRGDGVSRLDDPKYKVIDVNVPVYQRQIESGKPLKPTAYDQGVADAAGIPFHELLNRRFDALGIKGVEATEGSFGILQRESIISPGVKRLLDGPKTFNKISSAIDRSPNLIPAQMGIQKTAFHNATSIARKFQHPNPEIIGALWSLQTDEGRTQPNLTPAQQISQLIENNPELNMFIPYSDIASTAPQVAVVMQKHGDSHNTISGTSKSISRIAYSLGPQDMRSGANYMQSNLGFSPQGSAVLAGNIQQESSWRGMRDWGQVLGDGTSRNGGLVSWASWSDDPARLGNIENYLGKDISQASHSEQLSAMRWEMETYYPEVFQVFTDPDSSMSDLRVASKQYWGYMEEGDRFNYANQLLNINE